MKNKRKVALFVTFAFILSLSMSIVAIASNNDIPQYSLYLENKETGEIITKPLIEPDNSLTTTKNLTISSGVTTTNNLLKALSAVITYSGRADFYNQGEYSGATSYTDICIDSIRAINDSYYANGVKAGSDNQISPTGWVCGAITAFVYAKPGFTLREVRGTHQFSHPGYTFNTLFTSNSR